MQASGATSIGLEVTANQAASTKIKSVLETDDLTDFLHRAELADREFESEKERFVVIDSVAQEVVHAGGDLHRSNVDYDDAVRGAKGQGEKGDGNIDEYAYDAAGVAHDHSAKFDFKELSVPRRPPWDETTTPAELDRNERESFLNWRRKIAAYEDTIAASSASRVTVTPFEKNIEVWRQLWRVVERSDLIALVVDGRNPQFYLSMDLRKYVEEELHKPMIVIVNKCDYLTQKQRQIWHEYFKSIDGLEHLFFSAVKEQEILDGVREDVEQEEEDQNFRAEDGYPTLLNPKKIGIDVPLTRDQLLHILSEYGILKGVIDEKASLNRTHQHKTANNDTDTDADADANVPPKPKVEFGMVGFPNVGKSSVLNVLVGASKNNHSVNRVGVAAMPGKTKHFQTLKVPDHTHITLCDCPGLVFPSFVSSSADLILAGVYPLSQVRDFWLAVELICRRIPRDILEAHFGIELPRPTTLDIAQKGGSVALKAPTAEELLGTYCIARSLLAPSSGVPDYYRASRVVLRDYANGSLLYCHSPSYEYSYGGGDVDDVDDVALKEMEVEFHRETLATTFRRQKKLREKMGVIETADGEFLTKDKAGNGTKVDALEDDLEMLEMMEGMMEKPVGGNRGKSHKSKQKWGKKGRKQRNKDPYGCHGDPDEELLSASGGSGLLVNTGKNGSKSYTRMNYRGPRSAV
jgi:large subunit GTPase 1